MERHTSTKLRSNSRSGKQLVGGCPYPDCLVDTDGFMVWPVLTERKRHFYCRGCGQSGDILKLVQDIKGLNFSDACKELGIPNPYLEDGEAFNNFSKPQVKKYAPKVEKWQTDELQHLNTFYSRMKLALRQERPKAYLAERGISLELAESLGLGYMPALADMSQASPELEKFSRWCDRIIFPVLTPDDERGYCGRSLHMWQPGMDEDMHKKLLNAYETEMKDKYGDNANKYIIKRYLYTYKHAFFNLQAAKDFDNLTFVEGPFDVLACLAAGIPNAISIGITGIDAKLLPDNVCSAIMALDFDASGNSALRLGWPEDYDAKVLMYKLLAPRAGKIGLLHTGYMVFKDSSLLPKQ